MDGLALRPGDRQARNSDRLAPQGLSSVLDLEKQKRTRENRQGVGEHGADIAQPVTSGKLRVA